MQISSVNKKKCCNRSSTKSVIFSFFQIESALASAKTNAFPITGEAQESAEETLSVLAKMDGEDQNDADELSKILTRPWLDGLLGAHDHISAFKSVTQFNAEDALFERVNMFEIFLRIF